MTSLAMPTSTSPAISPKSSTVPMRRFTVPHEDTLEPLSHSRRASHEDVRAPPPTTLSEARAQLGSSAHVQEKQTMPNPEPPIDTTAHDHSQLVQKQETLAAPRIHSPALIAVDELEMPHANGKLPKHEHHGHNHLGTQSVKTIFVGHIGSQKRLEVPTDTLIAKSLYFRRLFEMDPELNNIVLEDIDPRAMGMLVHWLFVATLDKPQGFHSLTHWYGLYVLSIRFEIEGLRNYAMDEIRAYYRAENQSAPAYRLEYVYKYTPAKDLMRKFVVSIAASRALREGSISDSMRLVLNKCDDLAVDYSEGLVSQAQNYHHDVREGANCDWHVHHHTPSCHHTQGLNLLDGVWDAAKGRQDLEGAFLQQ